MFSNDTDSEANEPISRTIIASGLLAVVSILLLVFAGLLIVKFYFYKAPIEFSSGSQVEIIANKLIVVDLAGAVVKPGLYRVEEGERIGDLLEKAGGFQTNADLEFIEKTINKATKISDGMKIYIPHKRETETSHNSQMLNTIPQTSHNDTDMSEDAVGISLISVNSASQTVLESLSGIGPVTATNIINGRPYGSVDELVEKKIVKPSVFEKIKDKLSL